MLWLEKYTTHLTRRPATTERVRSSFVTAIEAWRQAAIAIAQQCQGMEGFPNPLRMATRHLSSHRSIDARKERTVHTSLCIAATCADLAKVTPQWKRRWRAGAQMQKTFIVRLRGLMKWRHNILSPRRARLCTMLVC